MITQYADYVNIKFPILRIFLLTFCNLRIIMAVKGGALCTRI
nr:MAG TPA: hypothetical protein [Bacteriophage sp.]